MQTYATMASRLSHFEPSFSVEKGFFTLTSASMCVCIGMRAAATVGERAAETPKLKNSICGVASFALFKHYDNFKPFCLFYGS